MSIHEMHKSLERKYSTFMVSLSPSTKLLLLFQKEPFDKLPPPQFIATAQQIEAMLPFALKLYQCYSDSNCQCELKMLYTW